MCCGARACVRVSDNKSNPVYNETKLNNKKSTNKFAPNIGLENRAKKGPIVLLC